ncbi:gp16 family phage-associated protein [Pseudomonas putida]|uniref:DNA-binding protein n=1 Tax=Pseudomonas putida TaxID=303 RepID=UPI0010453FCA|nr:DNA-binding protein [Pseudomonas putida]TCP73555.1 gp16 family phage-associated protein [Pseudomonas putida]
MPVLVIPDQAQQPAALVTPEQARAELDRRGMSIAEFSRINRLNKNLVSDLLNGRIKGRRGEAHRAAVLLGIKDGVIEE